MSRGFPSMTALLGLLAVAGYQNRDKLAEILGGQSKDDRQANDPATGQGTQIEGLRGRSVGDILSGGIGELVDRFRQGGHGDTADSWVGTGPNKDVAPAQLEQAIGPDVLDALSRQTGLPRDELLARLSRELPKAVDGYTPDGKIPTA